MKISVTPREEAIVIWLALSACGVIGVLGAFAIDCIVGALS